jgi:hypothetical protein
MGHGVIQRAMIKMIDGKIQAFLHECRPSRCARSTTTDRSTRIGDRYLQNQLRPPVLCRASVYSPLSSHAVARGTQRLTLRY